MSSRSLIATINGTEVGTLFDVDGIWRFEYAPAWLTTPNHYSLSPQVPLSAKPLLDGSTKRPVQWYFDNLLPEEIQRVLLARDARLDSADAFGLLAYYGAESAGSLVLLPPTAQQKNAGEMRALPDEELNSRILNLPQIPLTHGAIKRMSLAGAQHKLAVVLQDNEIFEPSGATPSTHILKPDHPDKDYAHSVINEWFVMRLANAVGLDVPAVQRRYVPAPVYLIKRFDRITNEQGCSRLHAIDACQLLGLDRAFKYHEGSIARLKELAEFCRSKAVARTRLFGWLVFNVIVGNTDAHMKNLSFMVSHEGIQLSPFYDLLSVAIYDTKAFDKDTWPANTELAWPILGEKKLSAITKNLLIDAGIQMGLGKTTAARILDTLIEQIPKAAQTIFDEVITQNHEAIKQNHALSTTFAGEIRCLNVIKEMVIKEMINQLKK